MKAWANLFKKDFRLTRKVFFIGIVFNVLTLMLALFVNMKSGDNLIMFIPLIIAIVFHVVYFPMMLFISLKSEANQLHLWLHNPQSAVTLLLSKILNGIIMTVLSLVTLYVMSGLLIIPKFSLIEAYWTDTWMSGLLIFPHIILLSIFIGVCVIVLWALYQFLKFKIGRWSWLVLIGVAILPGWIAALFESTKLYNLLFQWGGIKYHFPTFQIDPIQTYAGEYVFNFLIIIGLFYLSAWIIDKKVEV